MVELRKIPRAHCLTGQVGEENYDDVPQFESLLSTSLISPRSNIIYQGMLVRITPYHYLFFAFYWLFHHGLSAFDLSLRILLARLRGRRNRHEVLMMLLSAISSKAHLQPTKALPSTTTQR